MAQSIHEVMTTDPICLSTSTTLADTARAMRDGNVGDVLVLDENRRLCGIVTDRDIVVRGLATGRDPDSTKLAEICSAEVATLSPSDHVEDAVRIMSEQAVRRIPVVDDGRVVGIVAIGDLAIERDPNSALADISAARPNR